MNHSSPIRRDRYLRNEKITPRMIWENIRSQAVATADGYAVFDDTVSDKCASEKIESVRRQYSGNARGVIKGTGVVTCVYVNPKSDRFWLTDCRIYDPANDGKSEPDHVSEMPVRAVHDKGLPFHAVLTDSR